MNRSFVLTVSLFVTAIANSPVCWAYVNGAGKAEWERMTAEERRAYHRGGMRAVDLLRRGYAASTPRPAAPLPIRPVGSLRHAEAPPSITVPNSEQLLEQQRETERYDALGRLAAGRGTAADRDMLNRWRTDWQSYLASRRTSVPAPLPPEKVSALLHALRDSDEHIRHQAAYDLRNAGEAGKQAVSQLIAALDDADTDVRQVAAGSLGELAAGSREAIRALAMALNDPKPQVRRSAAAALRNLLP